MHIIDAVIDMFTGELNGYLLSTIGDEKVVPGNLLTQSGAITSGLDGRIVMSLVNIEEDRISRSLSTSRKLPDGRVETIKPEVKFNLYLLFIANPKTSGSGDNYIDSLENLSRVISFFQTKNYFDRNNTPSLDSRVEKLAVDSYSLTFEQQNHLWGSLGSKYMPSVMYRVRVVRIQEEQIVSDGPPITTFNLNAKDSLQ